MEKLILDGTDSKLILRDGGLMGVALYTYGDSKGQVSAAINMRLSVKEVKEMAAWMNEFLLENDTND